MVVVVGPEHADAAIARLDAAGERVWRIGEIVERETGAARTVVV
jgi:phosphoribosylformylglycinamidine cyclo-ligase